jgi:hypothetical protein
MFYSRWYMFHIGAWAGARTGVSVSGFFSADRDGAPCVGNRYWRYRFWFSLAPAAETKGATVDRPGKRAPAARPEVLAARQRAARVDLAARRPAARVAQRQGAEERAAHPPEERADRPPEERADRREAPAERAAQVDRAARVQGARPAARGPARKTRAAQAQPVQAALLPTPASRTAAKGVRG